MVGRRAVHGLPEIGQLELVLPVELVDAEYSSIGADFADMQRSINRDWNIHDGFNPFPFHVNVRQFVDLEGHSKAAHFPATHKQELGGTSVFKFYRQHKAG